MEEATFSLALDAIYDAATTFERWPTALERLSDAFGCGYAGLIDRNLHTLRGRASAIGVDESDQRAYFECWSQHDILRQRTPTYRTGSVETDQDIVPRQEFLRSDYYNGFMKPRDMHAVLRMTLAVDDDSLKIISMTRPPGRGDFDSDDVARCRRLMPHLQRAASVMWHVEQSSLTLTAFSEVLQTSARGVLLLDRAGRILFANPAVRMLAQSGDSFVLRRERIEALNGQEDAALQRLIGAATRRMAAADAARSGVMRLSRRSGKAELALVAAPLASATSLVDAGPVAFILITDPETTATRSESLLRQLFGLSAAEARVAERLMLGESPEQAATSLGIKISTARWHLASLYRKTGTHSQAQLMRQLLSVPTL